MTMTEIRRSAQDMLTPADIAPVLGSDPQTIRLTAKQHPDWVKFPFSFAGNRMKIPRVGFIRWMDGELT